MRSAAGLAAAAFLAACGVEEPPRVSPEAVEAAVEHAQVEMEGATRPAPKRASETSR